VQSRTRTEVKLPNDMVFLQGGVKGEGDMELTTTALGRASASLVHKANVNGVSREFRGH
jgi:hypothetical protein